MVRIASLVTLAVLSGMSSAHAVGDVTVKFKCQSMLHYTCTIQEDGDFSSPCTLDKDFLATYYANRKLKAEYRDKIIAAKAPLVFDKTAPYACSDGDPSDGATHFNQIDLTIAPGESKTQLVKAATCQPDTMAQTVSFTVVNGPVKLKINGVVNSHISPTPSVPEKSYETGSYQVKWTHTLNGRTESCDYPVIFEFSAPPAPVVVAPADGTPTLPPVSVPAPTVPTLPVTIP